MLKLIVGIFYIFFFVFSDNSGGTRAPIREINRNDNHIREWRAGGRAGESPDAATNGPRGCGTDGHDSRPALAAGARDAPAERPASSSHARPVPLDAADRYKIRRPGPGARTLVPIARSLGGVPGFLCPDFSSSHSNKRARHGVCVQPAARALHPVPGSPFVFFFPAQQNEKVIIFKRRHFRYATSLT